jgi:hypothetical protein
MKAFDWTKWSAIAEIISAIAILATLLYLAAQTNQNTQAILADSQQGLLELEMETLNIRVADPEISLLFEKPNPTSLELSKLYGWMSLLVRGRESMYRRYRLGAIDRDSYERAEFVLVYLLKGTERANNYWVNSELAFSSDFVERINSQLEDFDPAVPVYPQGTEFLEGIFSAPNGGE